MSLQHSYLRVWLASVAVLTGPAYLVAVVAMLLFGGSGVSEEVRLAIVALVGPPIGSMMTWGGRVIQNEFSAEPGETIAGPQQLEVVNSRVDPVPVHNEGEG